MIPPKLLLRASLLAILSLVAGLGAGVFWSIRAGPRLGNFHEPEGVVQYRSSRSNLNSGLELSKGESPDGSMQPSCTTEVRVNKRKGAIPESITRLYETIGDDGRITWGMRELAGLDDSSVNALQSSIDEAFADFTTLVRRNLTLVSEGSGPDDDGMTYRMQAFPIEGQQIWEDLKDQMEISAGKQGAEFLVAAFHPDRHLAFLGKYDCRFTFRKTAKRVGNPSVRVEAYDPTSGELRDWGDVKTSDLPLWMQGIFESDDSSAPTP